MSRHTPEMECRLAVVGTGMAGLSAALFAARRGIDTVLVGMTGPLVFSSGLLDLMGVHPLEEGRVREDPWEAVAEVRRDHPDHPYARLDPADMRKAMDEMVAFLGENGLEYRLDPHRNQQVVTALGTLKVTYGVPATMMDGARALRRKDPGLIVGFEGLKGFSSRQVAEALGASWPALRSCTVALVPSGTEVFSQQIAERLATHQGRKDWIEAVRPRLGDARVVGLPAVCGVYDGGAAFRAMREELGLPLFEIPTMPPTLTGLRLKALFEQHLPSCGIRCRFQQKVLKASMDGSKGLLLECGVEEPVLRVRCRGAVLATGRFFGRGLRADRKEVVEPLFQLPLHQPEGREQWHRRDFFHPAGHPVNRAGVVVDDLFRPVDAKGAPVVPGLFAAGSILAHQDWMRMKCGAGLAIATAYGAVQGSLRWLDR